MQLDLSVYQPGASSLATWSSVGPSISLHSLTASSLAKHRASIGPLSVSGCGCECIYIYILYIYECEWVLVTVCMCMLCTDRPGHGVTERLEVLLPLVLTVELCSLLLGQGQLLLHGNLKSNLLYLRQNLLCM